MRVRHNNALKLTAPAQAMERRSLARCYPDNERIEEDGVVETPYYKLRLFLSADIVGSTAFKQGQEALGGANRWSEAFRLFYSQVPSDFNMEWCRLPHEPLGPAPLFWKGVGDELLFVKELTDYRQALWTLHAWREAIQASRRVIRGKYASLEIKTTAWPANFPIANAEIELPSGAMDFIGPSMDTGFRLAALASPARMVVSIGLAWLLAEALQDEEARRGCGRWVFHYDGPAPLKGILGGASYPVFSVDMRAETEKSRAEDRLTGRVEAGLDDVITVCQQTIAEKPTHFFDPYIDPAYPGDRKFRHVPKEHAAARKSPAG